MKTTLSIVCVAALIFVVQSKSVHEARDFVHKLERASDECQKNPATHVDTEVAKKFLNGEPVDKALYNGYILCVSDKLGYQQPNGDPDVGVIKSDINEVTKNKHKTDEFYNKCSVQKNDRDDTALAIYICFHNLVTEYAEELGLKGQNYAY